MKTENYRLANVTRARRMKAFLVFVIVAYTLAGVACATRWYSWHSLINAAMCFGFAFWFMRSLRHWERSERFWKAADYHERTGTAEAYENFLVASKEFDLP